MARILVVDDETDVQSFVRRGLEFDAHEVETADDGAAALARIAHAREPFDLVVSDIKMPVMDGIQLALSVAKEQPNLPIVLMTGYADQRERASGIDQIVSGVLLKPFDLHVLQATVEGALHPA
ncbi:MAG: response regulator [Hyphomicrobiales bacterium]|nr:response regulator [Hyphomicrobiales bacterium]